MDRSAIRHRIVFFVVLTVLSVSSFGCLGGLTTAMYLLKGTDVDPDYAGLKGKKVAVVCRSMATLQYRNANIARDVAQEVSMLLQKKVPKVQIVEQRKVAQWTDEHTWEEFTEVGKAMKADLVVGIELESFTIFQGQTLYQGKADAKIYVYDCKKGGKLVFEKTMPQSVYPPSTPIPTSERREADFRREFEAVLADQIARHFYAHDPYADMTQDVSAMK
jgi:hypothetical protein